MRSERISILKVNLIFTMLISIPVFSSAQNWEWVRQEGGTAGTENSNSIATDPWSNCYIAGSIVGSNGFMSKYNSMGEFLWTKDLATSLESVTIDGTGKVYVTGKNNSHFIIAKLDSSGSLLWIKEAAQDSWGKSLSKDAYGNIYVTGTFSDTLQLDSFHLSEGSSFIAKYDSSGNCEWAKVASYGGYSNSISTDAFGNAYVTGRFYGISSFGLFQLTCLGAVDIFIAKYDSGGNCLWAKRSGGARPFINSTMDNGYAVATTIQGNVYVAGSFTDTATFGLDTLVNLGSGNDVFIAKYDGDGNIIWVKQAGGVIDDEGRCLAVDEEGNVYLGGSFVNSIAFGSATLIGYGNYDLFVAKLDASGNSQWAISAGGPAWNEFVNGIALDASNDIVFTGEFCSPAFFGSDTLISAGQPDIYIAKLGNISGINEFSNFETVALFPNPSEDFINVQIQLHHAASISVELFTISGQSLSQTNFKNQTGIANYFLDISKYPEGIYLMQIRGSQNFLTRKIIKQ
ncbi:MAG TPA: T9SS type A sorting domain-containing protein [Chitinophagales bacterium]|nr:T9SS type A sorting domain-containing protein [Chitinophagales bacterium]